LFDEEGVSASGVSERELDAHLARAAKKIPATVPQMFSYWQSRRDKRSLN